MFGKQVYAVPCPVMSLSDTRIISGNNSSGTYLLSKFFQSVRREAKKLFLTLLGLNCLHLKTVYM